MEYFGSFKHNTLSPRPPSWGWTGPSLRPGSTTHGFPLLTRSPFEATSAALVTYLMAFCLLAPVISSMVYALQSDWPMNLHPTSMGAQFACQPLFRHSSTKSAYFALFFWFASSIQSSQGTVSSRRICLEASEMSSISGFRVVVAVVSGNFSCSLRSSDKVIKITHGSNYFHLLSSSEGLAKQVQRKNLSLTKILTSAYIPILFCKFKHTNKNLLK